jgi:hypothetical protein
MTEVARRLSDRSAGQRGAPNGCGAAKRRLPLRVGLSERYAPATQVTEYSGDLGNGSVSDGGTLLQRLAFVRWLDKLAPKGDTPRACGRVFDMNPIWRSFHTGGYRKRYRLDLGNSRLALRWTHMKYRSEDRPVGWLDCDLILCVVLCRKRVEPNPYTPRRRAEDATQLIGQSPGQPAGFGWRRLDDHVYVNDWHLRDLRFEPSGEQRQDDAGPE